MDRIVFIGEAEPELFGVDSPLTASLKVLSEASGLTHLSLYTETDKRTHVHELAEKLGFEVISYKKLKGEEGVKELAGQKPDWILNWFGMMILSDEVLTLPKKGALNLHPGKLPEFAGRCTAQWAMRMGLKKFGAAVQWMIPEVDAGDLIYTKEFDILPDDTGKSLFNRCTNACSDLGIHVLLNDIAQGKLPPRQPQDLSKRRLYYFKECLDRKINWNLSAQEVHDYIRAGNYDPFKSPSYEPEILLNGCKFTPKKSTVLPTTTGVPGLITKVNSNGITVGCGKGSLLIEAIQSEKGEKFEASQLIETSPFKIGQKL